MKGCAADSNTELYTPQEGFVGPLIIRSNYEILNIFKIKFSIIFSVS